MSNETKPSGPAKTTIAAEVTIDVNHRVEPHEIAQPGVTWQDLSQARVLVAGRVVGRLILRDGAAFNWLSANYFAKHYKHFKLTIEEKIAIVKRARELVAEYRSRMAGELRELAKMEKGTA